MSNEERIQYFLKNYLPKNEILCRLPLNIPIVSFWAELQNRRKAGGIILPLHTPQGRPCWYTLTENMIEASEILCAEAVENRTAFDPYRMDMTAAMTEDMFFTSYVEGAQITLEEAMDFLNEGRDPASIEEQMIWNNRIAWEEMIRSIYAPITEERLLRMAYTLTEGMDNCAEMYRQSDTHPITAMEGESYRVPTAMAIPDYMGELISLLRDPEVHPLIKAPVSAAFLLTTRPYPEGNERLSRMLSNLILMRSGYDFFKDISLSGVIASENYLYYKNMCEIIRDSGEGDLTYFVEYYLEMLVRALKRKKDRERRREQEELERERMLATQPLTVNSDKKGQTPPDEKSQKSMIATKIRELMQSGELTEIDYTDIVTRYGVEEKQAIQMLGRMVSSKWLCPTGNMRDGRKTYRLTDECQSDGGEVRELPAENHPKLERFRHKEIAIEVLRRLGSEEITTINWKYISEEFGISEYASRNIIKTLTEHKKISCTTRMPDGKKEYKLSQFDDPEEEEQLPKNLVLPIDIWNICQAHVLKNKEIDVLYKFAYQKMEEMKPSLAIAKIKEMLDNPSARKWKAQIAIFILYMIEAGIKTFTSRDWALFFNNNTNGQYYRDTIRKGIETGFLIARGDTNKRVYEIMPDLLEKQVDTDTPALEGDIWNAAEETLIYMTPEETETQPA